jgi:hypothetical protein
MTGGARRGAGVPAASQHDAAVRPGDTAAGRVAVRTGGRVRPASRRGWPWVWALASGVVAAAAVRAPGAASDVRAAFAHTDGLRVSWLGVAVAAEVVSLAGAAAAQRRLLSAAGVSLPWRTVSGVVFASTGLARVMPAGPVAGGRLAGRGVPAPRRGRHGRVVVCAGGRAHLHGRPLRAAAGRGRGSWYRLPPAARLRGRGAGRRHGWAYRSGAPRRGAQPVADPASSPLAQNRPAGCGPGRVVRPGRRVRLGGWGAGAHRRRLLADAGLLAACFGLAGLPVPWRGLLLAYAAGQLAGRLVPLPGGLGGVEGGVLGALALTGTPPQQPAAAVIVYRVAGYWAVGAVGAVGAAAAATLTRRSRGLGVKLPSSQQAAMTRATTAFRPWQRSPDQPALHGLLAKVRDPGALPHLRPPAGPGGARSGTRHTDTARSRESKAPVTACPASRGCPKPGDTDGADRSVVQGGRRHRLRLLRHAVRQHLAPRRPARAALRRRTRAAGHRIV